jgi:Lon protease-like protein
MADDTTPAHRPITELPLFPLDVVLFPQMRLPLHIFEQRYRIMIQQCLKDNTPFGIVLATGVDLPSGTMATAQIGCMARILHSERLDDGRLNLEIVGSERFRILDTHENQPYRTALIERLDDQPNQQNWRPLVVSLQETLEEYLVLQLARLGKKAVGFELPSDPELLSFTASCVLPISNEDKQTFLEMTDTPSRLLAASDVLGRAVNKLSTLSLQEEESAKNAIRWQPLSDHRFDRLRCPN